MSGIHQISISPTMSLIINFLSSPATVFCRSQQRWRISEFFLSVISLPGSWWVWHNENFNKCLLNEWVNKLTPRILLGSAELFIARSPVLIPVTCYLWLLMSYMQSGVFVLEECSHIPLNYIVWLIFLLLLYYQKEH